MPKYLDDNGLLYFWQKIKNTFALLSHGHAIGDVINLQTSLDGKAPTDHASTATTYGKGTNNNYGHVKLSDSTSSTTAAASGGTCATPKAVKDALDAAKTYADGVGVTGVKGDSESSYRTGNVNLTPANIGAAPASHNHSASDITSGTLGVARGGTGASTLGAGVVYHSASGTGALSIASAANLVSAIGNSAVNRATADASGNNIADTYAKKTDIAGTYKYKGSVASEANLPSTGQSVGDVYNIESASTYGAAGANVAWNGTAWDSLGEIFNIDSITNAEIDTIVAEPMGPLS